MFLHNKGTGANPQLILVNLTGIDGRTSCYTFPYPVFETAVLSMLRELDPRDVLPKEKEAPSRVEVLRAKLALVRDDLARLQADLKGGYSKAIAAVLRDREAEEEAVARDLHDELARSVKPVAKAWEELPGLVEMLRAAPDPDSLRLRLRLVIRRLVEDARVLVVRKRSWQLCAVQMHFDGGSRRDFLIANQPAAYRRKGGWWARSLADVSQLGPLDLRRPAHVNRLEKALLMLDLDALS
jgi:hypothetical protein